MAVILSDSIVLKDPPTSIHNDTVHHFFQISNTEAPIPVAYSSNFCVLEFLKLPGQTTQGPWGGPQPRQGFPTVPPTIIQCVAGECGCVQSSKFIQNCPKFCQPMYSKCDTVQNNTHIYTAKAKEHYSVFHSRTLEVLLTITINHADLGDTSVSY